MKPLIAPLVLLAAVGVALALTAGGGRATGDAQTPGPPVPELSVARLGGDGDFLCHSSRRRSRPRCCGLGAVV